ncbi:MAG: Crp/Fnr family transcriptional regulator [Polyangiales bacterium]
MADRSKSGPPLVCPVYPEGDCPLCSRLAGANRDSRPFPTVLREAGSIVMRHGARVEHVIQVRRGRIKLSVADASGSERAYTMRGPGSLLGLEALLGLPALLDGRADVDSELMLVEPAAFERWLQTSGVPALAVVKHAVAENVRLTAERLLVDGNSEARLARFLLEREHNPFLSAWREVARHEVAGLLSMRPETLSRAIRTLQESGGLGPGLEIRNLEVLRRAAKEDGGANPL